jgi:hypothetical protein
MTTAPMPFTVRMDTLQAEETRAAIHVAALATMERPALERYACQAQLLGDSPLQSYQRHEQHDWIYRATAMLRSRYKAWRNHATEQAVQAAIDAIDAGDAGGLFCQLETRKRHAIARNLVVAALASYEGFISGRLRIEPGPYLEIMRQAEEEK